VLLVLLTLATDAGALGTPRVVKEINPSSALGPEWLTKVGSTLFFRVDDRVS
jgi:hypothetical protein